MQNVRHAKRDIFFYAFLQYRNFYEDKFYKGQENGRIIFGDIRFLLIVLTLFLIKIGTSIERSISKTYAIIFTTAVELYVALDALFVKCFLQKEEV